MTARSHFEIIITGRQLAVLIGALAVVVAVAFGLGVGVGLLEEGRPGGGRSSSEGAMGRVSPAGEAETILRAAAGPFPTVGIPAAVASARETPTTGPVPLPAAAFEPTPENAPTLTQPPTPRPTVASRQTATPKPTATPRPSPRPTATPPPTPDQPRAVGPRAWVQVAALSRLELAEGVRHRVIALGFRADQVVVEQGSNGMYRVRLGPFPDEESASRVAARLHAQGFADAFMARR